MVSVILGLGLRFLGAVDRRLHRLLGGLDDPLADVDFSNVIELFPNSEHPAGKGRP